MLVRIVKMRFRESEINTFKSNFEAIKMKIRNFEGCRYLVLYQDKNDPCTFFTYSHWDSTDHLDSYRHSKLFKGVWAETKLLFDAKPEAWSVDTIAALT